jgi:hypothetical protein
MTITCDPSCTWPDVAMAFVLVLPLIVLIVTWGRRK